MWPHEIQISAAPERGDTRRCDLRTCTQTTSLQGRVPAGPKSQPRARALLHGLGESALLIERTSAAPRTQGGWLRFYSPAIANQMSQASIAPQANRRKSPFPFRPLKVSPL